MSKYLDNLNEEVRKYFSILSKEFPEWLLEYIETPEMKRIGKMALGCGAEYTNLCKVKYWYSNLDHSVGVALIIWHFTHDKKQTLAGLFHDIATPVFKHVIDFLNDDYEKQESTEEKTAEIIKNSKMIRALLKRDNIKLEEVVNYKLYPIADNEIPQLSADRFEYNFSWGLIFNRVWELDNIRECFNNVTVLKNKDGIFELGFRDLSICEKYISIVSKVWPEWISNRGKIIMQFLADMIKAMNERGYIALRDLYILSEKEIINKIINCNDKYLSEAFKKFQKAEMTYDSNKPLKNKYCVKIKSKKRYLIPLIQQGEKAVRIDKVSKKAKKDIESYLNFRDSDWVCFDFDFNPSQFSLINK